MGSGKSPCLERRNQTIYKAGQLAERCASGESVWGMTDRLVMLFAEELGVDVGVLSEGSSPENVPQWDSLAAMRLVARIEEEFNTRLSTKEIMKMRTIGIVREVLHGKGVL